MIRSLLKLGFRRFGARYDYDTGYMETVADVSGRAALGLSLLPLYTQYRGPKAAVGVWAGAIIASTREGDCGPCVQLVVDMALEQGVPADQIALCLQGSPEAAGDVGLGFRFCQAAVADSPDLPLLRDAIEQRFGAAAVTAASFAASGGRIYPVLKRGLGYGQICSRVTIKDQAVEVAPSS